MAHPLLGVGLPLWWLICSNGIWQDESSVTDQKVDIKMVYQEISAKLKGEGITTFKCKPVLRKYCFDQPDK